MLDETIKCSEQFLMFMNFVALISCVNYACNAVLVLFNEAVSFLN
jgi:hypothetical protein